MTDRVQLDELKLINFRNIAALQAEPSHRFNVIFGNNGMGKTNILEAIYLLGALRSFRTSTRKEIVRDGHESAKVSGIFGDVCARMSCEVTVGARVRKISVDGKPTRPEAGHFRTLPMVLFHPGNMDMVQAGPDHRRRFLDRALFQAHPMYPSAHKSYGRALASRNAVLKEKPVDRRSLDPFSVQLASFGAQLMDMRRDFLELMTPLFEDAVNRVSGGNKGKMTYRPKVDGGQEQILAALETGFPRDEARGFTGSGPHMDDVEFQVDGMDARKFASQGQQRTVALGAKIAETIALKENTGRTPLLLLDDVSSELDRDRNRHLFEFLQGVGGQVFITTTHRDHILTEEDRRDFFVKDGVVEMV